MSISDDSISYLPAPVDPIRILVIPNPFDPYRSRIVKTIPWKGPSAKVQDYVWEIFPQVRPDMDITVGINGGVIPFDAIDWTPVPFRSSMVIMTVPHGGGEGGRKNPLMIIGMLALSAFTMGVALPAIGLAMVGLDAMLIAGVQALAGAALMGGGAFLLNSIFPPPKQETLPTESPAYGWTAVNMTQEGGAVPVIYGDPYTSPFLITRYIEIRDNDTYIHLLYAVADHEVDSITEVTINDMAVSNYTGVMVETRLGTIDQAIIPGFESTIAEQPVNIKLDIPPEPTQIYQLLGITEIITLEEGVYSITFTTPVDTTGFVISLMFPGGLFVGFYDPVFYWVVTEQGYADVTFEYSVHGAGVWTTRSQRFTPPPGTWGMNDQTISFFLLPAAQYDIRMIMTTLHATTPPCTVQIRNIYSYLDPIEVEVQTTAEGYDGLAIILCFPSGLYRTASDGSIIGCDVHLGCQIKKTTDVNWIGQELYTSERKTGTIYRTFSFSSIDRASAYDVRAYFVEPPRTWGDAVYDCYLDRISLYLYDNFSYPGVALLGIRALATEKLGGSPPEVRCKVTRAEVPVYNSTTGLWEEKDASVPAWICYDMLINDEYGMGIDYTKVIYNDFLTWANWCLDTTDYRVTHGTRHDFRCSISFDVHRSCPGAMGLVETLGWGRVVQRGSLFGALTDCPRDPVQMFGVSNIKKDSFSQIYIRSENMANRLELAYYDGGDSGKRKYVVVHRQDWTDAAAQEIDPTEMDLIGCTSRALAIYHGQFIMARNQLLERTVSIEVDVDALGCTLGDLTMISHDVANWGTSGRIVSATANTAVLRCNVTMEAGKTYQILVRHQATDVMETQTVHTIVGTGPNIILTGTWTAIPAADAIFAFGEIGHLADDFSVMSISRASDMSRKITLLEYDVDVYRPDREIAVDEPISVDILVDNIKAREIFRWDTGTNKGMVELTWTGAALAWHVWYGKQPADGEGPAEYTYVGLTYKPIMNIYDLDIRSYYTFVVSYSPAIGAGESYANFFYYGWGQRIFQVPKVHGLKVKGDETGLNYWTGIDLTCEWFNMMYFQYPADDEPVGAGSGPVPFGTFVGYHYKIHTYEIPPVLLSEGYLGPITEGTYSYATNTYDSNLRDAGANPHPNLIISLWGITEDGKESWDAARIICWNQPPADITGLTAYSKIGGARFEWDANEEADFMYYQCQVAVAASAPDWNTVEILQTSGTSYTRNLTGAEILAYGFRATVYFRVVATDAFFQPSANVVETSVTANQPFDNHMEVGAIIGTGISGSVMSLIDGDLDSAGVTVT